MPVIPPLDGSDMRSHLVLHNEFEAGTQETLSERESWGWGRRKKKEEGNTKRKY